jgi:hypothetical protein
MRTRLGIISCGAPATRANEIEDVFKKGGASKKLWAKPVLMVMVAPKQDM